MKPVHVAVSLVMSLGIYAASMGAEETNYDGTDLRDPLVKIKKTSVLENKAGTDAETAAAAQTEGQDDSRVAEIEEVIKKSRLKVLPSVKAIVLLS